MSKKSYVIVKHRMGFFGFLDNLVVTILKVFCFIFVVTLIGMFAVLGS